jgi:hypothetical protein
MGLIVLQVIVLLGLGIFTDVFFASRIAAGSPGNNIKTINNKVNVKKSRVAGLSAPSKSSFWSYSSSSWRDWLFHTTKQEAAAVAVVAAKKVPPRQQYYDCSQQQTKIPLIIGGSDGSGTRAFADIVKQLGVMVVADDKETFDLHAASLFKGQGWPVLVNQILAVTHSGNYQWSDLPAALQRILTPEVDHLVQTIARRCSQQTLKGRGGGGGDMGTTARSSSSISYAIKAPVSMLTLPVLGKFMGGRIKFLHIVRDGRDVALSTNQSPVTKFYNTSYVDSLQRSHQWAAAMGGNGNGNATRVKAMELWNDWNLQVQEWGTKHQMTSMTRTMTTRTITNDTIMIGANNQTTTHTDDNDDEAEEDRVAVDYLVMRSEDLLDPDKRLECLERLAEFVGSSVRPEQLCCMSRKATVDYGKSHSHEHDGEKKKKLRNGLPLPLGVDRGITKYFAAGGRELRAGAITTTTMDWYKQPKQYEKLVQQRREEQHLLLQNARKTKDDIPNKDSTTIRNNNNNSVSHLDEEQQQQQLHQHEVDLAQKENQLVRQEVLLNQQELKLQKREEAILLQQKQHEQEKRNTRMDGGSSAGFSSSSAAAAAAGLPVLVGGSNTTINTTRPSGGVAHLRKSRGQRTLVIIPPEKKEEESNVHPIRHRRRLAEVQSAGKQDNDNFNVTTFYKDFTTIQTMVTETLSTATYASIQHYMAQCTQLKFTFHLHQKQIMSASSANNNTVINDGQLQILMTQLELQADELRRRPKEDHLSNVKQRYGKWMTVLADDPELSRYFYQQGGEALRVFGYEPRTDRNYPLTTRTAIESCDPNATCPGKID